MALRDDFERWARLSARMLRRGPAACARLVQEEGVGDQWQEADAHWYGVMTAEVSAGRLDRVQRYRTICDEVLGDRINAGEVLPNLIERFLPAVIANEDSTVTVDDGNGPSSRRDAPRGPTGASRPVPEVVESALTWSLEQYAWLCAELSVHEDRAPELWSARGVTDTAAQRAVQRAWERRLAGDAGLEERHHQLLAGYRQRLRSES